VRSAYMSKILLMNEGKAPIMSIYTGGKGDLNTLSDVQ
jgi:hypothetical protein